MDKKLSLEVADFSVLDEYSDSQLAVVEIYVCHDGNNAHNMPISLETLKKAKKTLKNKFLVAGYDGIDFEGHEPDEQIVGFFPESSKMSFVKKDGKTFLVAQAIMSKVYADWAYQIFVEDNERAVSMEISVLETEIDDDGTENITKFVFNGVTLLGKTHQPACEGSNASIIKFSRENALKVYSKHFRSPDAIKKDFVEGMRLAENSGKEDSAMENKENEIVETVEQGVVKTEVVETEETIETEVVVENEQTEEVEVTEETIEVETNEAEVENFEEDSKEENSEEKDSDEDSKSEEDEETYMEEDKKEEEEETEEPEEKKFEALTVEQKYEVFRSAVRETLECGYLETFDDEYIYVYDYCDSYTFRYSYTLNGTTCEIDKDSKTRVMRGGYVEFEKHEEEVNKVEALESEICELKGKLATYEAEEKERAVNDVLAEVEDVLPSDKISELQEKSANYSLDNLGEFENEVKAAAFEAVKLKDCKYSFTRLPLEEGTKPTGKYSW